MNKIFAYLRERFPIIPVLLFAFGYGALGTGSWPDYKFSNTKDLLITIILFALIFTFFLLRQRVIDEFKDSTHDLKYFPDRPVPRGLISRLQLMYLGLVALFFEWLFVFLLGNIAPLLYLPVFVYSLLMAKEFFVSEWINKHFNLYLLSHEVIFIFFGIFFISAINKEVFAVIDRRQLSLGVLLTAPFSIEVIRKFSPRFDKKGRAVGDTYSTVWGRNVAISILLLLILLTGLLLTIIKSSLIPLLVSALIALAAITFGKKSDKAITVAGALNFLGLAILSNLIWQ